MPGCSPRCGEGDWLDLIPLHRKRLDALLSYRHLH